LQGLVRWTNTADAPGSWAVCILCYSDTSQDCHLDLQRHVSGEHPLQDLLSLRRQELHGGIKTKETEESIPLLIWTTLDPSLIQI